MFDSNPVLNRCRNSRCKAWLKGPVENRRNAFCCAGCEVGFYRRHCRVCERPFEAKNSRKELCGRDECRNEFFRNKPRFFSEWYPSATLTPKPEKSSTKSRSKTTIKSDQGFTVGADYDREVLRKNAIDNRKFWDAAALIGPTDPPINILGGYKFPNAPNPSLQAKRRLVLDKNDSVLGDQWHAARGRAGQSWGVIRWPFAELIKNAAATELEATAATPSNNSDPKRLAEYIAQIPDDLSIPAFLKRGPAS